MNEFKIGDRVITTDSDYGFFEAGNVGTIVAFRDDGDYIVEFNPGQPGVDYDNGITSNGSWYVFPQNLEHIQESRENTPWYETEEGKEWLSKQSSIEEQFVQEKQKRMPKRGERYTYNGGVSKYILTTPVHDKACLIELTTGNRWTDPVGVDDPFAITEDEWNRICSGDEFTLVE